MKKIILLFLLFNFSLSFLSSQTESDSQAAQEVEQYEQQYIGISNLKYFEEVYPDVAFSKRYDGRSKDWIVKIKVPLVSGDKDGEGKIYEFYWANGSLLPESELKNANKYWSLLYNYPKILQDPENLTENEKEQIKQFSSRQNRKDGAGTPMFFFDALYDSQSRIKLEQHIVRIRFLGNLTNVHERMKAPLKCIEEKVFALAKTDPEVQAFLDNIKSNDAYYWRIIEGTNRKSFHSLGIAVDVLPKKQGGKQIFWSWAKDKYPDTWMLIPLKKRWMPPEKVIEIFEEEGFIWGGKWVIFDNMHFEFHPELIKFNFN